MSRGNIAWSGCLYQGGWPTPNPAKEGEPSPPVTSSPASVPRSEEERDETSRAMRRHDLTHLRIAESQRWFG